MCRASGDNEIRSENLETAMAEDPETYGRLDLIAFGFPCQDISQANAGGKGLKGKKSGIFFECMRVVNTLIPRWVIVENVPRLLSLNNGWDMAIVLETLSESGYGCAWRVLDSRYFNLAQRRERVFIVGCLGKIPPPEILYEPQRGIRHDPQNHEAPPHSKCIAAESGTRNDSSVETIIGRTLTRGTGINNAANDTIVANTQRARGDKCVFGAHSECIIGKTINAGGRGSNYAWRDDYIAAINNDGKGKAPRTTRWLDGPRGCVIGNAVSVDVAEWIGQNIVNYESNII